MLKMVENWHHKLCRERNKFSNIIRRLTNIDKPTHDINNSKLRIDLLFYTNQNVISKYGDDDSLFDIHHHNMYGKINNHVPLPSVFIRELWNYSKADIQNIQKAILDFNWRKDLNLFLLVQRLTFLMKHY